MTPISRRRVGTLIVAVLVVALGGTLLLSMFRKAPPPRVPPGAKQAADSKALPDIQRGSVAKPTPPRSDYLGSASCTECHPQIAEQYKSHSMANSAAEIATATPVEDFGEKATFSPDQRHVYSVEKTPTGVKHHERLVDAQGETLYDQSVPVDYAIGSGAHGKSYLLDREGTLFMSPITWYSKAQLWNLSPGYKLPAHHRFERKIVAGCVDCHVGRVNYLRGQENHFGKPPFLELSIGCERCHGPGGRHVAHHRTASAPGDVDPITNPAKLDPARREDICAQCHLQGEARIPHYGCVTGDFRPGQRLEETMTVFVQGTRTTRDGKSRAVSHVEQMRSSVCFNRSGGKFGCISCHDPHSLPSEPDKATFYREKCLACHQQRGCSLPEPERRIRQANDSCVACHMAPLGASDIPHTSQTDHRVLRIASALPPHSAEKSLPEMFDNADQRLPELAVIRARGLWLAESSELKTDSKMAELALSLLSVAAEQLPDDVLVQDALGTASAVAGKPDDAIKFWKRTLEIEPHRALTLQTIALTLHSRQRTAEALPYIERCLKVQPWNSSLWRRYSHLLGLAGKWPEALAAVQKSEAIDPSAPRLYQWSAEIHKRLGNEQQSRHYQDLFERIKPLPM